MTGNSYDILVIGRGINGACIARDAAGRGLSVMLCEMGDLGGATSSASSKLIHGGLRYLEHYAFRLVGEALRERQVLLRNAPHIIWPMRFVLPHAPSLRPAWMVPAAAALVILFLVYGPGEEPAVRSGILRGDPGDEPAHVARLVLEYPIGPGRVPRGDHRYTGQDRFVQREPVGLDARRSHVDVAARDQRTALRQVAEDANRSPAPSVDRLA